MPRARASSWLGRGLTVARGHERVYLLWWRIRAMCSLETNYRVIERIFNYPTTDRDVESCYIDRRRQLARDTRHV